MKLKPLVAAIACSVALSGCGGTSVLGTVGAEKSAGPASMTASERYKLLGNEVICVPCEFNTFTQGGWGAVTQGGNPGVIRDALFDDSGANTFFVTLGSTDTGCFSVTFDSSAAVEAFLPQTEVQGTPAPLDGTATNPTETSGGVFTAQMLALALNLAVQPDLSDVEIVSGFFAGMTIGEFFALANEALGCGLEGTEPYSISNISDQAGAINQFFNDEEGPVTPSGVFECPTEILPLSN